jgi:hypothetical protein
MDLENLVTQSLIVHEGKDEAQMMKTVAMRSDWLSLEVLLLLLRRRHEEYRTSYY